MKQSLRRLCGERDHFLFVLGINTGLRISDIVTLRVKDLRGKTHALVVEKKSKKFRRVLLKPIQDEIETFTKGMDPDDWLFAPERVIVPFHLHRPTERL